MTYHFTKIVDMSFDDAVISTKVALKRHNFRVLTEIDMKDNFKKGLNVDFRQHLILGACNPELSYRALQAEDKIGTMLPYNVVLQQQEDGRVEVSAIDPVASMQAVTHVTVGQIAEEMRSHLQSVILRGPRNGIARVATATASVVHSSKRLGLLRRAGLCVRRTRTTASSVSSETTNQDV